MDVGYFLRTRLDFVRSFYEAASRPFAEIKNKIEAGEEPYVPRSGEGEDEPPFLTEWQDADECLQVLAYACVSMLSAALRLYFKAWERELGKRPAASFPDEGLIGKYRSYFRENFGIRFEDGQVDLVFLEEIVLVRNRIQHPEHISSSRPSYSGSDLKKLPRIFFMSDIERRMFADDDMRFSEWMMPTVSISSEQLKAAIREIEKFGDWLEVEVASRLHS